MAYFCSILCAVIGACVLPMVSSACDLSLRDQLLLIRMTEEVPGAGMAEPSGLAGAEVDCASLGPFRMIRHSGAIYFLDPQRAFARWSRTGISVAGGPSAEWKSLFFLLRQKDPLGLWREFGRGPFTPEERASLSVSDASALLWKKMRLLDDSRYHAAAAELPSPQEELTARLLLMEKAQWYVAANEPSAVQTIDTEPGKILHYSSEAIATVTYRDRRGASKKMVLHFPVNTTMIPYVGYPIREVTDIRELSPPFAGSNPLPR